MTTTLTRPATPAQLSLLVKLARESIAATAARVNSQATDSSHADGTTAQTLATLRQAWTDVAADVVSRGYTFSAASDMIGTMLSSAKARVEPLETGMYLAGGEVFKVQQSKGTDRRYALKLDTDTWKFEYAPGAVRTLTGGQRMTLEQAKEFGVNHGVCCVCGATLTDPKSVEAGIGPVCAKRF